MRSIAFDTSVLVAGLWEGHPHHAHAFPWLQAVESGAIQGNMTAHALAETWSVLSRLPIQPMLTGAQAEDMVRAVAALMVVHPITEAEEFKAIARCRETGAKSGAVYDALHLVTAERAGVRIMVTFNVKDFLRLRSDSPVRLVDPVTHAPESVIAV